MHWCKEIVLEGGSVFYFADENTHALYQMRQTQMDFPITDYQYFTDRDDEFASPGEFFSSSRKLHQDLSIRCTLNRYDE